VATAFLREGERFQLYCTFILTVLQPQANNRTHSAHVTTPTEFTSRHVTEVLWLNGSLLNVTLQTFIKIYCPDFKSSTAYSWHAAF